MNGRRLLPLLGLLLVLPVAAFAQEKADSPAEAGVCTPDNPPAHLEIEGLLPTKTGPRSGRVSAWRTWARRTPKSWRIRRILTFAPGYVGSCLEDIAPAAARSSGSSPISA